MMQQLTDRSALLIRLMFTEPALMREFIDGSESNLYSSMSIDSETCKVVLGKTRFMWWNKLIGATKEISLEEFAFKTVGMLADKADVSKRSTISKGLLDDVTNLHREGRSNDIIDRLFVVGYMGVKTAWSCFSLSSEGSERDDRPTNVRLHINEEVKTFRLPGSGEPIIEVAIGPKSVRYLGSE